MQKPTSSVLSSLLLLHANMHAMLHSSVKHATVTWTELSGRKANRKHGAFECLCSLCSRKKDVFTDLLCTVPKFQCRYCLQVSCSKLILNAILGQPPLSFHACTFGCTLQLEKQVPFLPVLVLMCHVNMQIRIE